MRDRYLLYLDILGFSELAEQPERVLDLYQIMDRLNIHRHPGFRAIVFSDTLLVYNIDSPQSDHDRQYCVMFLAEFAQDLLSRIVGREYYFRALLTRGPFEHLQFPNLEAFFGRSLIDAYRSEPTLQGVGLFMDESVLSDNRIFRTERHCDRFHYVFLTQHLDRNLDWDEEAFPIPGSMLDDTGIQCYVYPQLMFLRDVWEKARNHADPRVRSKFQATWTLYEKKLPGLCAVWASSGFNFEAIADVDWESARKKYESELESTYYKFSPDSFKATPQGNNTEDGRT